MRFTTLAILAVSASVVCGCKSDSASQSTTGSPAKPGAAGAHQLAGIWTNTDPAAKDAKTEFTFDPGGTYTMIVEGTAPNITSPVTTTVKGTYTQKGDDISLHIASIEMASPDPKAKAQLDEANTEMKAGISQVPNAVGKLTWKDNDNAILTMKPPSGSGAKDDVYPLRRKS